MAATGRKPTQERKLRYWGRIADSRDPAKVTRLDLRGAVEDVLVSGDMEVSETEPAEPGLQCPPSNSDAWACV